MFTGRKLWWAALLWLLLSLPTTSVALAQGGAGGKVLWGGNYTLAAGKTLSGDLTLMGGNATLEPQSQLHGNVTVVGGNLVAGGHIQGNVTVVGGTASLQATAVVDGWINAFGGSIARAPGAIVRQAPNEGQLLPNLPSTPELGPLLPLGQVRSTLAPNPLPRPARSFHPVLCCHRDGSVVGVDWLRGVDAGPESDCAGGNNSGPPARDEFCNRPPHACVGSHGRESRCSWRAVWACWSGWWLAWPCFSVGLLWACGSGSASWARSGFGRPRRWWRLGWGYS